MADTVIVHTDHLVIVYTGDIKECTVTDGELKITGHILDVARYTNE